MAFTQKVYGIRSEFEAKNINCHVNWIFVELNIYNFQTGIRELREIRKFIEYESNRIP